MPLYYTTITIHNLLIYNYNNVPVVPKAKHRHNVNQDLVAFMVLFVDEKVTKLQIIIHHYTFYRNNIISYTLKCDDENIQFYHNNNVSMAKQLQI